MLKLICREKILDLAKKINVLQTDWNLASLSFQKRIAEVIENLIHQFKAIIRQLELI